jgi:Nodulation protein Z (NodZ)
MLSRDVLSLLRSVWRDPRSVRRLVHASRKFVRVLDNERRNHGILSVRIDATTGFFAQLNWCLYIFAHCDERATIPRITLTSSNYVNAQRGPDWFRYFFEQYHGPLLQEATLSTIGIREITDLGLRRRHYALTIERACQLARKYLRVRQEITQAADAFARQHFADRVVLGVHYRGTDKHREAPHVSYSQLLAAICAHLQRHPEVDCVFIATDESALLSYVQKELRSVPLCACDDLRSDGALPVHSRRVPGDPYRKGREALVNALLLSRCHAIVRTASLLSGWASVFNPQLPVTLINEPYKDKQWFPDREIVRRLRSNAGSQSDPRDRL